jgi:hypothetical protein
MEYVLNKENLIEYGFKENQIKELLGKEPKEIRLIGNKKITIANNIDKKIYTDLEAGRIIYFENKPIKFPENCLGLISEFYKIRLAEYLHKEKELLKDLFNYDISKKDFTNNEISIVEKELFKIKDKSQRFKAFETYLRILRKEVNRNSDLTESFDLFINTISEILKNTPLTESEIPEKGFELWQRESDYIEYLFVEIRENSKRKYIDNSIGNFKVYAFNKLDSLKNEVELFMNTYKLNHVNNMPENSWFFDLRNTVYQLENEFKGIFITETKNDAYNKESDFNSNTIKPEIKVYENLDPFLKEYGFFELPKIKELTKENKKKLVQFIKENDIPYIIAMFEYLEFIKHLLNKYFQTKKELNNELSDVFNTTDRTIKGNINCLNKISKERLNNRYNAYKYLEMVANDYNKLK